VAESEELKELMESGRSYFLEGFRFDEKKKTIFNEWGS
jgi:hypothetical protein